MPDELTPGAPPPFGVYLHVPFCAERCDYCAFATWTDRHHLVEPYLHACATDIGRAVAAGMPPATSVFVGGGTPSLVPARMLVEVLAGIPLAPGAEITVECNPDTVTADLAHTYRNGGVTRISLGVQSMVPLRSASAWPARSWPSRVAARCAAATAPWPSARRADGRRPN